MRRVVWFAAAAAVGSLAWSIALLFGVIAVDPRLASAIGVGIECLWVLAVLLFTVPLEAPDAIERGLGKRSACRRWCRGLQFARPVAAIFEGLGLLAIGGGLQTTLAWTADAMGVAGAVGLLLFAVLLVRWAEWIEDETAASWARGYLWAAAGVVLFGVLAVATMALLPPLVLVPMLGLALCGLALLLLLPASLLSIGLALDATVAWRRERSRRDETLRDEVRGRRERPVAAPLDDAPIPLADPEDPGS